ncbi:MAG: hypothetical protein ACTHK5_08455 [Tsuneonella sp.]
MNAPAEWAADAQFWIEAETLLPPGVIAPGEPSEVVIADPGNSHWQDQSGAANSAFIFQWGRGNKARQLQSGTGNRVEAVQISPGASMTRGANAGAGNGGEFDVFGFEIDPGHSQTHNRSPEEDGSAAMPGEGNRDLQQQSGAGNFERSVQIGWSNASDQTQVGDGNSSIVVQLGVQNRAETEQRGDANASVITQQGTGNVAFVRQGGG